MSLEIINNVLNLLKQNNLILLIQYGSSLDDPENANDIDLFAICSNNKISVQNLVFGPLDLVIIGKEEFEFFLSKLDPAFATEPILTGKFLFGDLEYFKSLRKQVIGSSADKDVVSYLFRRSILEYLNAINFLNEKRYLLSLESLSFSVSYSIFSSWYYYRRKPIRWKELCERCTRTKAIIREVQDYLKICKKVSNKIQEVRIKSLIEKWSNYIVSRLEFI